MEASAFLSYAGWICGASSGFTGIFCHVLEFCKNNRIYPCGTDSCRNSGSLGLCQISFPWKKTFIYHIYRIDDDAFSGDDA